MITDDDHIRSLVARPANRGGSGDAMKDLIAGQIDLMFDQAATVIPQVRAGRIRAYAVTAASRLALAPDVPTVDEAGLKEFHSTGCGRQRERRPTSSRSCTRRSWRPWRIPPSATASRPSGRRFRRTPSRRPRRWRRGRRQKSSSGGRSSTPRGRPVIDGSDAPLRAGRPAQRSRRDSPWSRSNGVPRHCSSGTVTVSLQGRHTYVFNPG